MKAIQYFLVVVCMMMSMVSLKAQGTEEVVDSVESSAFDRRKLVEEKTQEVLEKVIKYASERKYDSFAKVMAYVGRDPNRNMRSMINPNDPHEALEIENTCNFIYKYASKSALHHARDFRSVKGAYSDIYFWTVEFSMLNGKSKEFTFMFLELDNKYLFCQVTKA